MSCWRCPICGQVWCDIDFCPTCEPPIFKEPSSCLKEEQPTEKTLISIAEKE